MGLCSVGLEIHELSGSGQSEFSVHAVPCAYGSSFFLSKIACRDTVGSKTVRETPELLQHPATFPFCFIVHPPKLLFRSLWGGNGWGKKIHLPGHMGCLRETFNYTCNIIAYLDCVQNCLFKLLWSISTLASAINISAKALFA